MTHNLITLKEYTVYPGEYVPMPDKEVLFQKLMHCGRQSPKLLVNMDESGDCFNIKIAVPASKREDIFLYVEQDILYVIVLDNELKSSKKGKRKSLKTGKSPGLKTRFFEQHLTLPNNADAEFVSAEYNQGILN